MGCKQFKPPLTGVFGEDEAIDAWAETQASSESLSKGHFPASFTALRLSLS